MRRLSIFTAMLMFSFPILVKADHPVVVELYTSQGCSSCPPADRVLEQLINKDDVIALALHVDYWDYLGWRDEFADPAYSARQRRYARVWNERSVYTPQIVVQGTEYMVGSRGDAVRRQIMAHEDDRDTVDLDTSFSNGSATITVRPRGRNVAEAAVYLVGYSDGEEVAILRGELRGRTLNYVNIVESWETIANWDGRSAISIQTQNLGDLNYVVIVQEAGQGPILTSARVTP